MDNYFNDRTKHLLPYTGYNTGNSSGILKEIVHNALCLSCYVIIFTCSNSLIDHSWLSDQKNTGALLPKLVVDPGFLKEGFSSWQKHQPSLS